MTEQQVAILLAEFERKHDSFRFTLDGWSTWRVVRFHVAMSMINLPFLKMSGVGRFARLAKVVVGTLNLFGKLIVRRRVDGVIKSFASALRERDGSRYRDVYFDEFQAQAKCFKIEVRNSSSFDRQRKNALCRADADADVFRFWGAVAAAFFPRRDIEENCKSIQAQLRSSLGLEFDWRVLQRIVSSVYWESRLYGVLLRRLQPTFVVVADTSEYALNAACLNSGIRFVELQHGIFGQFHPDALPQDAPGTPQQLLLPSRMGLYGDYWRRRLQSTAMSRIELIPIGSSQIEKARKSRGQRIVAVEKKLVVTSQGIDTNRLCEWLMAAIRGAPEGLRFRMIVKLHPAYDIEDEYRSRIGTEASVEIVPGSAEPNIYDLLSDADLHLSIGSACHFDAVGIGVVSAVIPLAGHEAMLEVVDGSSVCLAKEPADIWPLLGLDPPLERSRDFFVNGYSQNIRALMQ